MVSPSSALRVCRLSPAGPPPALESVWHSGVEGQISLAAVFSKGGRLMVQTNRLEKTATLTVSLAQSVSRPKGN